MKKILGILIVTLLLFFQWYYIFTQREIKREFIQDELSIFVEVFEKYSQKSAEILIDWTQAFKETNIQCYYFEDPSNFKEIEINADRGESSTESFWYTWQKTSINYFILFKIAKSDLIYLDFNGLYFIVTLVILYIIFQSNFIQKRSKNNEENFSTNLNSDLGVLDDGDGGERRE